MSEESLLGIDIGTSSTKAALVRADGLVLAQAQRAHTLSLPRPGWAEHDAERTWWQDVVSVCRELAPDAGLRGVCVSGIGPCVVPCDARLRPLRPAILYGIDSRAAAEIDELDQLLGAKAILERGGSALSAQALGPKLLWLRHHEREVWARTAGWFMASSFVAARLTGAYVLDHHSASQCNPLYDIAAADWARDWADDVAGGVPLPELVWPTDQIGTVTHAAAAETGLPVGTPVVAGTVDAWAEAFSVGVRRPGDLMIMYGSTLFFVQVVGRDANRHPLLWLTQAVERDRRTLAAGMSTAGLLTDWVRDLGGSADWDALLAEASTVPPGSRGLLLLPYFAGERTPVHDPLARGVVAGLSLAHGPAELLRATYEGTAFGVRQILALLNNAAAPASRVVAVGGGTRSELWLQTVSDIVGIEQQVPEQTIGAAYGDALVAAIGIDLVAPDMDWSRLARTIVPSANASVLYDQLFDLYGRLYSDTADVVHRLVALTGPPSHETAAEIL